MKFSRKVVNRCALIVASAAVFAAIGFLGQPQFSTAAQKKDEPGDLATFMRKKLDASSLVLEGLTVKDADLIKKGATQLLTMSKSELWNAISDADYREFNSDFRSAIRKLEQAADEKNFDNALLQWYDGVKGCVECHKYVREQRVHIKN